MSEAHQLPPQPEVKRAPLRKIFNTSRSEGYKPASKGKRIVACILDGIFSAVLSGIVGAVLGKVVFASSPLGPVFAGLIQILFVTPIYWVGFARQFGATPGKKLMGLKIINQNGTKDVSVKDLAMRELVFKFVSALPLMLGYFWGLFRKDGKTWHDHLSNTKVIDYR